MPIKINDYLIPLENVLYIKKNIEEIIDNELFLSIAKEKAKIFGDGYKSDYIFEETKKDIIKTKNYTTNYTIIIHLKDNNTVLKIDFSSEEDMKNKFTELKLQLRDN
jgi:hypothetical protein